MRCSLLGQLNLTQPAGIYTGEANNVHKMLTIALGVYHICLRALDLASRVVNAAKLSGIEIAEGAASLAVVGL